MPRKLKTYETSLGFFDLAIAAPSMKAALEAWGSVSNLFHQGVAKESTDPDIIATTMSKPGVVLRRPVGSTDPFKEHADLPTQLAGEQRHSRRRAHRKPKGHQPRGADDEADRKAAVAFEKEEKRRERERRREEAARERERGRRQRAIDKAQAAFDGARRHHEKRREAIEKRSRAEDARWERDKEKLETALRRAKE